MSVEGMQVTVVANGLVEALKKDGVNLDDRLGKNASNYVREIVAHLSQPQPVAQGEAVAWLIRNQSGKVYWEHENCVFLSKSEADREVECVNDCEENGSVWTAIPVYAEPTPTIPTGHRIVPEIMTAAMINAWSGGITVTSDAVALRTNFQKGWARVLDAAAPDAGGV